MDSENPTTAEYYKPAAGSALSMEAFQAKFKDQGADPSDAWQLAWENGMTPWDQGQSQAGLVDLFNEAAEWGLESVKNGRALVAGCGRGYDVVFLSGKLKECWGLDISAKAVELAQKWANEQSGLENRAFSFHQGDFYKFDIPTGGFDLAYDYTFLCTIVPSKRPCWAQRYSEILNEGGKLVVLMFPIDGDRPGGPPYSIDADEVCGLLSSVGFKKLYSKVPPRSTRSKREVMTVWEKQKGPMRT